MQIVLELILIAALVFVNGLLAMAELAVVSARTGRLRQRADVGDGGAAAALELAASPTRFLAAVQIGITLVGILAGAYSGATLAEEIARALSRITLLAPYAEPIALGLVVIGITYLSLVFGELVPKRLALGNPERIAAGIAPAMRMLTRVGGPFVRILSASTTGVIRLLGVNPSEQQSITEDDVRLFIRQAMQAGALEAAETELAERAVLFDDRSVDLLMTPRARAVMIDVDDPLDESWARMAASHHTMFPVYERRADNVIGVVAVKDLWAQAVANQPFDLRAALAEPLVVPETASALSVLALMRQRRSNMALVIDEYGGLEGVVTLDDMMAALTGSPIDRTRPVRRPDGSWLVDAITTLDELAEEAGIRDLPGSDLVDYNTVGGLVLSLLGRVPTAGDTVDAAGWRFEVLDMDGRRIDKVLISTAPSSGENESGHAE